MNNNIANAVHDRPIGRALVALSVPVILGNLLQAGYQLTDAFWGGRLGAHAVAAVAISFPVTFLVIALGSGIAIAGTTLIAQYFGAGRQDMVDQVAGQTMVMVLIISIFLGAIGYAMAPRLVSLLGAAQNVAVEALGFMRVSFIGVAFVFTYAMFQALMRGIGQTRLPLLIVVGTVLLNFALDPLFIFGYGPIPGYGVVGAAVATLVTQGLASVLGLTILIRGRHGLHMQWASLRPDPSYLQRAFILGLPAAIDLSTRALGLMAMSFLAARLGTLPAAVYGVGSTVLQVVSIPAAGLSMAVSSLVGQNMGAGNIERAAVVARLGILYGFGALTACGVVVFVFAPELAALFVRDEPRVIADCANFLRIMALSWGGVAVQYGVVAVPRACGQMSQAMTIALFSQWLIQFPLAWLLSMHSPLNAAGIWWSFPLANVASAVLAIGWFARGAWKHGRLTHSGNRVKPM